MTKYYFTCLLILVLTSQSQSLATLPDTKFSKRDDQKLISFVQSLIIPHRFVVKRTDRLLRGGSYSSYSGGRSGSWSSGSSGGGSSYNWNRNRYNNNNYSNRRGGGFGRFLGGLAIAAVGLALLGGLLGGGAGLSACLAFLCCGAAGAAAGASGANRFNNNNGYYNASGSQQPGNMFNNHNQTYPQQDFDREVQQAKSDVENSFSPPNQSNVQPYSGQYTTSFIDPTSGTRHNASLCLFFTPDPQRQGFRISGQGSDIDGSTVIEDGFAKYDGRCWWIERAITGDVGLLVLSKGQFNFHQHTFQGTWLANTMLSGPYLSFQAIQTPNQQPNAPQNYSGSIPVVSGVVVPGHNNAPVTVVGKPL